MLTISDLSKSYVSGEGDTVMAVDDVDLSIKSGEFFTLLGPSGCGKTTTLRCIAGLEVAERGTIVIGDQTAFSSTDRRLLRTNERDISMVFQSYAIWPHMTVFENVAFPLQAAGVAKPDIRSKVNDALELVGLGALGGRSATELSGGQQQRVALARAIVKDAKVLLLDEPLSNLDAKLRVQMRAELRDLQRRLGITTVYVTHDQDEALSLSDRIALMQDGKVLEVGSPVQLYMQPRNVFTAEFVGQAQLHACTVVEASDDEVTVDTSIGQFRSSTFPNDMRSGKGSLLIRPEHIEIARRGADVSDAVPGHNRVVGKVVSKTFSGNISDCVVDVRGERLALQALSITPVEPGEWVELHIPVDRCVLIEGLPSSRRTDSAQAESADRGGAGDPLGGWVAEMP